MKRLKTFAGVFTAVLLCGGLALAGWNIKQGDRGETSWVDEDGVSTGVGSGGLIVEFTNIADAWTHYIPVHRGGVVTKMYVVHEGQQNGTAASVFTLSQMWSDAVGSIWTPVNGLSITATGTRAGIVNSDTPGTSTYEDRNNASLFITSGDTLAVRGDGSGSDGVEGTVIIIIE